MENVFEALEKIGSATLEEDNSVRDIYYDEFDILKQAFTELKAIKESNPSEELKYVNGKIADLEDDLQHYTMVDKDKCKEFFIREDLKQFTNIKQALLKAQEKSDKDIAFDLIDTKNVDIKLLKWAYPSVEAYNTKVRVEKDYWWRDELSKEEFEFLGRMVGAE